MTEAEHSEKFAKMLCGRKIVAVRFMTEKESKQFYWYKRPLIIMLDDGTTLIPQSDDEGNDGGAVYVIHGDKSKGDDVIYVLS